MNQAPYIHFLSGLLILVISVSICSCTKISLQGSKEGSGTNNNNTNVGNTGLLNAIPQVQGNNQPPPLDGEWELDYESKGEAFISSCELAQSGNQLAGKGADQTGLEWQLENGQVNGTRVSFVKIYTNADPPRPAVQYDGEIKYLEDKDFTGWMMEGAYTVAGANGQTITGKWVANPTNLIANQAPSQAVSPDQSPQGQINSQGKVSSQHSGAVNIGNAKPSDISGRYDVGYNFNFKRINSKMWLKQDSNKLSGDGIDTTTGEKFTISKGWYSYPKITIVRHYSTSQGAKENRNIEFKAQISSDGRNIVMKGETQFGGTWDARLVR